MNVKATIVALLLMSTSVKAQKSFPDALQEIATVKVFAFGGIGFAGRTSDGETDFRIILAQPRDTALDALYRADNPQAKAYALAGIYRIDKDAFKSLRTSWHGSGLTVRTEEGCIVSEESLQKIADQLNAGKYDAWTK
jgi:hypothetical protein